MISEVNLLGWKLINLKDYMEITAYFENSSLIAKIFL